MSTIVLQNLHGIIEIIANAQSFKLSLEFKKRCKVAMFLENFYRYTLIQTLKNNTVYKHSRQHGKQ